MLSDLIKAPADPRGLTSSLAATAGDAVRSQPTQSPSIVSQPRRSKAGHSIGAAAPGTEPLEPVGCTVCLELRFVA